MQTPTNASAYTHIFHFYKQEDESDLLLTYTPTYLSTHFHASKDVCCSYAPLVYLPISFECLTSFRYIYSQQTKYDIIFGINCTSTVEIMDLSSRYVATSEKLKSCT